MTFPLYDNLKESLSKKDLTTQEKEQFISDIQHIDENGRDLVYVLIQCYRIENENSCSSLIPYKGTEMVSSDNKNTSTLVWNFMDFPIPLRRILYKFVCLNKEKLINESDRQI